MIDPLRLHPSTWQALQSRRARLPHALLLAGQRGIGKFDLARAFAAALLCENPMPDGQACGQCLACGWQTQGNHPDFRLLVPDALGEGEEGEDEGKESKKKASRQITIDQVRALDEFLSVGTHRGGLRIVLVYPAEAMNRSTANALLKSLEEPLPGTLFLLVSSEPNRLLPTIRSRCQAVPVPLTAGESSVEALRTAEIADPDHWMALAGGAPLLAMELANAGQGDWIDILVKQLAAAGKLEVFAAAAAIDKGIKDSKGKLALKAVIDWMLKWSIDLSLARNRLPVRYFVRQEATIAAIAASVPEIRLLHFYRRLLECRREVEQPLNAKLFLEELFLNYRALF